MMETFVEAFGPYPFAGYTVVVTDDDLRDPARGARHLRSSATTTWHRDGSSSG